jgi:hypothetical protein
MDQPSSQARLRKTAATEAIQDAVAAACRAGKRGQDAQVIVQGEDLLFRTEWTYYGHDPYLPAPKDAHPRQFGKGRSAVLLRVPDVPVSPTQVKKWDELACSGLLVRWNSSPLIQVLASSPGVWCLDARHCL